MGWHDKFFSGIYSKMLAGQFDGATNRRQAGLIKRLLRLRRGQSVLDLPCGQGRLTLAMARLGLRATGVDQETSYIRRAKSAAKKGRVKADFRAGDMRRMAFHEEFDGAFNWFGSFGYFSDQENRTVLKRYFQALKPGGCLLVDCVNKDWILRNFKERMDVTVNGIRSTQENRWSKRDQRVRTRWTFTKGRKRERYEVSIRLFNAADLRRALKKSGFGRIELFTAKGGKLGRTLSPRIIAVARKA